MNSYDHDAPLYGFGPLDPSDDDTESDRRICSECGNPWPPDWDGCMRTDCPTGARNIEDTRGDNAYHLAQDY